MRHCMVVHSYYPLDARVEREARMLTTSGFEVDVVCLRGAGERGFEVVEGVRVHRMALARHRGVGAGMQLLEYLAFFAFAAAKVALLHLRRGYGVIQLHNLPDFLVFAGAIPRARGARLLLDLHDLSPEFYASRFHRDMRSWPVKLVRLQERLSAGYADQVLTVTDLWRQVLIDRGVPAKRVAVVMNVADERIFKARKVPHIQADGALSLLYHGTITKRYGLDVVVEALARVRDRAPIRLIVHGRGEFLDELHAFTSELRVDDVVSFSTEPLTTSQLADLIRSADVGVVPYRSDVFTDGILPTKLMEYAAVGVPAIASRTPAIEAYFDEGMVRFVRPGSVDDMADALLELHRDADLRARLGKGIGRFAEAHSYRREASTYVAIVRSLHESTGAGGGHRLSG